MNFSEHKNRRYLKIFLSFCPFLLPLIMCCSLYAGIAYTSAHTSEQEQTTLLQALQKGAVHYYALTGQYPPSLQTLTDSYHITYDADKFVVEYVPNGTNLFPSISVFPLYK